MKTSKKSRDFFLQNNLKSVLETLPKRLVLKSILQLGHGFPMVSQGLIERELPVFKERGVGGKIAA